MKRSEKTKRIIAGVFSAMLAFNCLSAGGVKTFAADADFAEERTAEEIIKELEEKGMHGDINADGTYPLLSSTYIVYTDKAPQSTRSFAKWAVSDEGQRCVLEGGPKKTQWHIEGNWNIVAKKKCFSHGTFWYECWDADDGDYYGRIKSYDLEF